jgi:hypothetical protein
MASAVIQRPRVGGELHFQGIRHLAANDAVICVVHVDQDDTTFVRPSSKTELNKLEKRKGGKSVHFQIDDSEKTLVTSVEISYITRDYTKDTGIKKTMSSPKHSPKVSPVLGRKNAPVRPSPLLQDSTRKLSDNQLPQLSKDTGKTVNNFGLSPKIKRRGSPHSEAASESSVRSGPAKKHSWPIFKPQEQEIVTPVHCGFVGSEEELEKLKFIKNALSPLPTPISPEMFRKRSNTVGEASKKPGNNLLGVETRERSVSFTTNVDNTDNDKVVYGKNNSLTNKIKSLNKKPARFGSAH